MIDQEIDAGRDRALGALLGLAVGDALGATVEFSPRDSHPWVHDLIGGGPFDLEPGQWTDDTSMALCMAESLLAQDGFDAADLMSRMVHWWRDGQNSPTGTCFDIPLRARAALIHFEVTGDPVAGNSALPGAGNGSLTRVAPIAIRYRADPDTAIRLAGEQSLTTHAAAESCRGCALLAELMIIAMESGDPEQALAPRTFDGTGMLSEVAAGRWRAYPRAAVSSSPYVVDTLEAALWSINQAKGFREAVLVAANLGDDADTVAAVTGQLAGAIWGASSIPEEWRRKVAWSDHIAGLAEALHDRSLRTS